MEKQDDELKFKVYLKYVNVIGTYLDKNALENIQSMMNASNFRNLQLNKNSDINHIGKMLRNAWLTEQQIIQSSLDIEFTYIANHWICVQVYYCVYLVLRVLHMVLGKEIKDSHTAIIQSTNQDIKQRMMFPLPWSMLCVKDGDTPECYHGIPEDVFINHSESILRGQSDFYNVFTKLLKTTRHRLLDKKYDAERKRIKMKRLSKAAKEKMDAGLYPTSLFDFLYRLRVRSNYEDADMFFSSGNNQDAAVDFNRGMQNICNNTLLLLEAIIAKCLSMKTYEQLIDNFQEQFSCSNSIGDIPCAVKRWKYISRASSQVINQKQLIEDEQ